ncbi:MAG: TonB-dependent receptor [Rikenellaceae bacterium]
MFIFKDLGKSLRLSLAMFATLLCVGELMAQNLSVTGVIVNKNDEPIVGAYLYVPGTTIAAVANNNGEYEITAPQDSKLIFEALGYKSVEVGINRRKVLNVVLEEDALHVEDVVVVGYGVQKKASVVGAVNTIEPAELVTPVRSLSNSIAGKVAGILAVQRSGQPGQDDAQFWIRGISTFTGNQDPLVLVDGIERSLDNVDPLEIESFSVLKDASATAVYGVRGANGVIIINTKKGFDGEAKLDFRYEQGLSWATKRPEFLGSYAQASMYNEAIDNTSGASQSLKFSDTALEAFRTGSDPELYPDVDWQELLMKQFTLSEKVSANISGGGKSARYFVAMSYYSQEGQYAVNDNIYDWISNEESQFSRNVEYNRFNMRTNVDIDLFKHTTVSIGIQADITSDTEPAGQDDGGSDNVYTNILNTSPYAFPAIYSDGKFSGRSNIYNPYLLVTQRGYYENTGNNLRTNITIKQGLETLTKGLDFFVKYAYDAYNYNSITRRRDVGYYYATGRDTDGDLIYVAENMDNHSDVLSFASSSTGDKTHYFESSLVYDRTFDKHEFGGLILFNMKDYSYNTASDYISSLPYRSLGIAGRVTYGYNNKYLLEMNIGYNGSENFPEDRRMGLFPAAAFGWIASNEDFLRNNQVVDFLKLRASYGQVGSDQIPSTRFAYLSTVDYANGYSILGQNYDMSMSGLGESQMGVTDITWEVATKYNLGVDLTVFKKLTLNADVFYERRDNIFIQPQVSQVVGLSSTAYANAGVMDNRGFEVSGEWHTSFNDKLSLSIRGNYTFARNKVIDDGQYYENYWQDTEGTRYGERLLYDALHLFSADELASMPDDYTQFGMTKEQLSAGDIRYRDVNDDNKIDEDDMIWADNPENPEHVLGFGATLSYKNFDFSFLAQGAFGASTYINAAWYFYPFQSDRDPKYQGNIISNFADYWSEDNQNPYAFAPRVTVGEDLNNYRSSTWWTRSADYLRIKNVELGYTLPESVAKKMNLQNLRVYLSGVNLYTFSKFASEFWDPEVGADSYPIQATVYLGLNLTI